MLETGISYTKWEIFYFLEERWRGRWVVDSSYRYLERRQTKMTKTMMLQRKSPPAMYPIINRKLLDFVLLYEYWTVSLVVFEPL